MSESRFPWLQQQGGYLKSVIVNDVSSGELPIGYMHYEIKRDKMKDIELVIECMENDEVFILNKEHIPFLEQLLSDLKEVTKQ
ncbi:hypothetical protein LEO2_45 [Bacillus phage Leo2]|uniref:Uncharacterized protein n=1 Tax=Bacillus phage Leo2 TaxID=1815973 RepID=A0A1S5QTQ2_9CAUD|nr:hypothetical protein LEO2_45 [Bacillus phage Leo2]